MEEQRDYILPVVDGMSPRRVHAALSLLSNGDWWTITELVRETAAPRRAVEALLAEIVAERSGDRFRLAPGQICMYDKLLSTGRSPFELADPVAHLVQAHADVVDRIFEFIERAPRGRQALDHVSATAETVVRRALLLGASFWLPGTRLLCVGDHDLTSLAVGMINPHVEISVVDIDDRILAYIDASAADLGIRDRVRTRWADLRLGLAPSVREYADVAITDPPYTPDGAGLFVARAVEALRDQVQGRILLAYGASERTPMLALKVQKALLDLNLVSEAIYPDFNRYIGAEAIGSAANLYVLRPTTKTLPAADAQAERVGTAIYTQGAQSVDSLERSAMPPVEEVMADGFSPRVLVGSWPKDVLPSAPRARLTTWLAKPYAAAVRQVAIALPAGLDSALVRVLLASRSGHVRVVTPEPPDLSDLTGVLSPVYELAARGKVIDAVRRPLGTASPDRPSPTDRREEAEHVLHTILTRGHGKVANSWRDALIALRPGLTQRQARAIVAEAAPWAEAVTPVELPMHRLRELAGAVQGSLN
jgi:Branched-chain polyamine synthase A C-terminal domain